MNRALASSHLALPILRDSCVRQGDATLSGPKSEAVAVLRTVVLVSLDWTRPKDPRTALGHASLLAALRTAGRVCSCELTASVNISGFRIEPIAEAVLLQARQLPAEQLDVAVGTYVWNECYVRELLRLLRQEGFRGRIVLGGPQISYSGSGLEELYPEADAFVRGYGEEALVALTATYNRIAYPGVHWAGERDQELPTRVDLTALPSPFLMNLVELQAGQRFIRWETQRGCPYRCSFCQHREPGARLPRRGLSEERLRDEIALFARHEIASIAILDPIFNIGKHAVEVLLEFRRHSFRGKLSLQCRFELVRPEFLDACTGLSVCLEFGLQTIHDEEATAIGRPNDLRMVTETIVELHRREIPFEVSLIFGLPNQTLRSFRETVDFCLKQRVPTIKAFPLMLLRGTALDRDRVRWGLIESDEPIPAVIQSNSFNRTDWDQMMAIAKALERTEGMHPATLSELAVETTSSNNLPAHPAAASSVTT